MGYQQLTDPVGKMITLTNNFGESQECKTEMSKSVSAFTSSKLI